MDGTKSTVRKMLTAIEAPLYDIGVLSDRGMLPGLDNIPAAAILDRRLPVKYSIYCTTISPLSAVNQRNLQVKYSSTPAGLNSQLWRL